MTSSERVKRTKTRHRPKKESNTKKYPCGCFIRSSNRCNAFFVSLCDYHRGETNVTSASLEQLEDKMENDEVNSSFHISTA